MVPLRTRFAPSPTGDLHLGGLLCAFASYVLAKKTGGAYVVRVEDLDTPRVVRDSTARILADLADLGLVADEPKGDDGPYAPYTQSACAGLYEAAIASLGSAVYPCDCSRAEVARAASAPHAGEELVYPGTCRAKPRDREMKREPALRLAVPAGTLVRFDDLYRGPQEEQVDRSVGDFVLRRGDGVFSYQLACALDDRRMNVDLVLRGADLLGSTARQIHLGRLLGATREPRYGHLPLVLSIDGERVAKRTRGTTIRELRARGLAPADLFGFLGYAAGLFPDPSPRSLERAIDEARAPDALLPVPREVQVPASFA